jgi:putative membrane protein insertion efficiency factor
MRKIETLPIVIYQVFLSPILVLFFGQACRFEETCSEYTKRMILERGLVKGATLGLIRLSKCQPFYTGNLRKEIS